MAFERTISRKIVSFFLRYIRFIIYTWQSVPYYFSNTISPLPEERFVFIELKRNQFGRYLYVFLKMLSIQGYTICIPRRMLLLIDLCSNKYTRLLLTDRVIRIGYPEIDDKNSVVRIPEEKLSPDYFRFVFDNQSNRSAVYVPMSQHPLMYRESFWNAPIESAPRKNSLFMAGNFNNRTYARIEKDATFDVLSRVAIYKLVKQLLFQVNNFQELSNYVNQEHTDNRIILVDIQHFWIPMSQLRNVIARFEFFFALPGVVMPFSHNVIEAMSVGCIPFIQNTYAELFRPPLQNGIHCITFNGAEDIAKQISSLFLLSDSKKKEMRHSVNTYYYEHLTPVAIGRLITTWNMTDIIYLQAEQLSVLLLRVGMDSFKNNPI